MSKATMEWVDVKYEKDGFWAIWYGPMAADDYSSITPLADEEGLADKDALLAWIDKTVGARGRWVPAFDRTDGRWERMIIA